MDRRRNTPKHIIITLPKIKHKVKILEATREKETVTYKGLPIRRSADFSYLTGKKGLARSIPSHERQGPTSKIKDNERILKAVREKEMVTYKGLPIRLSADFSNNLVGKKRLERGI